MEKRRLRKQDILMEGVNREYPTFIGMKANWSDEELREVLRGCYRSWCGTNASFVLRLYELCAEEKWEGTKPLHESMDRLLQSIMPLVNGLMDSAIDRALYILGGGNVGLECVGPFRAIGNFTGMALGNSPGWHVSGNSENLASIR
jgi:hypothetical protein